MEKPAEVEHSEAISVCSGTPSQESSSWASYIDNFVADEEEEELSDSLEDTATSNSNSAVTLTPPEVQSSPKSVVWREGERSEEEGTLMLGALVLGLSLQRRI